MKIQYEPAGRKEVARLLQGIKDQQPQALFDAAPAETRGGIPLHIYETALSCSNAQAVIREIRAAAGRPKRNQARRPSHPVCGRQGRERVVCQPGVLSCDDD